MIKLPEQNITCPKTSLWREKGGAYHQTYSMTPHNQRVSESKRARHASAANNESIKGATAKRRTQCALIVSLDSILQPPVTKFLTPFILQSKRARSVNSANDDGIKGATAKTRTQCMSHL